MPMRIVDETYYTEEELAAIVEINRQLALDPGYGSAPVPPPSQRALDVIAGKAFIPPTVFSPQPVEGGVFPVNGVGSGGFLPPSARATPVLPVPVVPGRPTPPIQPAPGTSVVLPGSNTAITTALSGSGLPGWIISLLSAGGGYLLSQLLGGGGGNGAAPTIPGVDLGGPGVKEPAPGTFKRTWNTWVWDKERGKVKMQFWTLFDGRVLMYHHDKGYYKIWRPKKMVVLSSDPRMSQIRRLERVYDRTIRKLAKKSKALKLAK